MSNGLAAWGDADKGRMYAVETGVRAINCVCVTR